MPPTFLVVSKVILRVILCFCYSSLTASFRSHIWRTELFDYNSDGNGRSKQFASTLDGRFNHNLPSEEINSNSPDSTKSFSDTQLEIFHHRHGLLILHLLATLMFVPSLMAWLQVWIIPKHHVRRHKLTGGIHFIEGAHASGALND